MLIAAVVLTMVGLVVLALRVRRLSRDVDRRFEEVTNHRRLVAALSTPRRVDRSRGSVSVGHALGVVLAVMWFVAMLAIAGAVEGGAGW